MLELLAELIVVVGTSPTGIATGESERCSVFVPCAPSGRSRPTPAPAAAAPAPRGVSAAAALGNAVRSVARDCDAVASRTAALTDGATAPPLTPPASARCWVVVVRADPGAFELRSTAMECSSGAHVPSAVAASVRALVACGEECAHSRVAPARRHGEMQHHSCASIRKHHTYDC